MSTNYQPNYRTTDKQLIPKNGTVVMPSYVGFDIVDYNNEDFEEQDVCIIAENVACVLFCPVLRDNNGNEKENCLVTLVNGNQIRILKFATDLISDLFPST